ncbi:hypothetical protein NOC27_915 [Nitrosococcus oceani AFC27]|nr:hypothetical protein NOC27_915 [Nitrosococcus oceani AFC27]
MAEGFSWFSELSGLAKLSKRVSPHGKNLGFSFYYLPPILLNLT